MSCIAFRWRVEGKVANSGMAGRLTLVVHAVHAQFESLRPILKDMKSGPWTAMTAGDRES